MNMEKISLRAFLWSETTFFYPKISMCLLPSSGALAAPTGRYIEKAAAADDDDADDVDGVAETRLWSRL